MIINYFLMLVTLLLFAGLALDSGLVERRSLLQQNAADAAAQEAMYENARKNNAWASAGQAQAAQNGFTNGVSGTTVSIVNPPTSGAYSGDTNSFEATVKQTANTLFMGFAKGGQTTSTAISVARIFPTCVWIMNPSSTGGGSLNLASAGMSSGCGVYVATTSGTNLEVDAFGSLSSTRIRVAGSSANNGSSGSVTPTAKFGAARKNDPLAYIAAPIFSSCSASGISITNVTNYSAYPGTYCGGVTLVNSTVFLNAGLYIITGGLSMNNSTIHGESGVTLYFTSGGGSGYGKFSAATSGNSGVSGMYLKAPLTSANGGIPGISIFADRNWVGHGSQGFSFANTTIVNDGIWYIPNTGLSLWSSPFSYYTYNGLVIDNIYQYGSASSFAANYSALPGGSPYHYEDGFLVQ